jgi:hypothetical protein
MLPSECADRRGKDPTKHQGRAGTREVKIGCFFTQTSRDPDTGDPIQDPGSASYISTFEAAATFAVHVKAEYHRRGFDQIRQPIVLGDGAKWIWTIAGERLPHATQIVDYFHAREHLADPTKALTGVLTDPAASNKPSSTTSTWATPPPSPPLSKPSIYPAPPPTWPNPPTPRSATSPATTTACNTPTSAPTATTSAPAPSNPPATPSSNNAPNEPACTGPSKDSTPSSHYEPSTSPAETSSSGPHHKPDAHPAGMVCRDVVGRRA